MKYNLLYQYYVTISIRKINDFPYSNKFSMKIDDKNRLDISISFFQEGADLAWDEKDEEFCTFAESL